MVRHYKTMENEYLCFPMIKANPNKMTMCIGDVDCENCKEKLKDYLLAFNKSNLIEYMNKPNITQIQTNLKDLI